MPALTLTATAFLLSACSSMSLQNIDFMGDSDFDEEISQLEMSFPSPDEIPAAPSAVRTDQDWDEAAREMQALGAQIEVPDLLPALTDEEFAREFAAAKAAAQAYKADDPS